MKKNLLVLFISALALTANAQTWSSLGSGSIAFEVNAMAVYNGDLYAGGTITNAGGIPANRIARWNGTNWDSVGSGMNMNTGTAISSLAVYNGELYAGGLFDTAGGVVAHGIARWNGTNWSSVGNGLGAVFALAVFNGDLYAAGNFSTAAGFPGNNIAKWNGTSWDSLGSGTNPEVTCLTVYNGALYAGGDFTTAGGVAAHRIAKWNGIQWDSLGSGMNSYLYGLGVYNGELYAGGQFNSAGNIPAHGIAKWNGTVWDSVGTGTDYLVRSIISFDGKLFAGGYFTTAGGIPANHIATWNGVQWDTVASGTDDAVTSFVENGGDLYVAGWFSNAGNIAASKIAKWKPCSAFYSIHPDITPHTWVVVNHASGVPPINYTWSWGDSFTSSGPNPSHTYSDSAYYNICLSITDANGCSDTYCDSSTFINRQTSAFTMITVNVIDSSDLITTYVGNIERANDIILYPNPASNQLTISGEQSVINQISIYNTLGEKVYDTHLLRTSNSKIPTTIDVSGLTKGIYLLQIESGEKLLSRKFVVE